MPPSTKYLVDNFLSRYCCLTGLRQNVFDKILKERCANHWKQMLHRLDQIHVGVDKMNTAPIEWLPPYSY
jgi:hypothetical protein